jgi:hypothetical protein
MARYMKTALLIFAAAIQVTAATELDGKLHPIDSEIWDEIRKADGEVFYRLRREVFVQTRRYNKETKELYGERMEIKKADLPKYLAKKPKKEFGVVMIEKNTLSQEKLAVVVAEVARLFQQSGFKRILVLGAHGTGVIEWGDYRSQPNPDRPNKSE